MQDRIVTVRAPGKVILIGEHAVVYGKSAIALAVNRFSTVTATSQPGSSVYFEFLSRDLKLTTTMKELQNLYIILSERFKKFTRGECSVKDVLRSPLELIQYAFIHLVEELSLHMDEGLKIQIDLKIPVCCGMGSSAAIISSLIYALANYFGHSLKHDECLYFSQQVENLQHGRSSGLDIFLSINGGCHCFTRGVSEKLAMPKMHFIVVNTGKSESSTGECVEVASRYLNMPCVLDEFDCVIDGVRHSLQQNNLDGVKQYIKKGHKLLVKVGVVPKKVEDFVTEIEERGNAAKISGAGSVRGDKAGIVLIVGENGISDIVTKYGYEILPIEGEFGGISIL